MKFPDVILQQHTAVLGKTGSGKTSTAKLAVEQVVAAGARVCVLDPIKSDWWGLTSSADGKRAGLPFHILGGPRGHVPLHASAGKAVGEIVASGALPLSIIDMADFEPGGQAKFFVDFAPTLLRKMRGVVYLVIEEAHLFAPKERSGVGAENLSIHWAKTLATAGRSKGVRLQLVTQRTQALHNALLGSCDTLIAHRLTAPADQEPVVKWLKANTSKEVLEEVSGSLASLKTGEGWICSGEAKLFTRTQFGRIRTYDNTATPTGDSDPLEVKTAAVDADKLRAIIGAAVKDAAANDPRELRKRVAVLERDLAAKDRRLGEIDAHAKDIETKLAGVIAGVKSRPPQPALRDRHLARAEKLVERIVEVFERHDTAFTGLVKQLDASVLEIAGAIRQTHTPAQVAHPRPQPRATQPVASPSGTRRTVVARPAVQGSADGNLGGAAQRVLDALAELEQLGANQPQRELVAFLANYTHLQSKGFVNAMSGLRTAGLIDYPSTGSVALTEAGREASHPPDAPRTATEVQDRIIGLLGGASGKILRPLIDAYPEPMPREEVARQAGYGHLQSKGFVNAMSRLRTLGFIDYPSTGTAIAKPVLFLEG